MKINYKITSVILLGIVVLTYSWIWAGMKNMGHEKAGSSMHSMHSMSADTSHQMDNMMDMTMSDMVKMMEGKSGKALEKEFIMGMIPHHQGAVDMARKLLEDPTISQEMKDFATEIIKAQEGEIYMMKGWLKKY